MINERRYDTDLDTKFDMTAGEDAEITEVSFSNLDALMIKKAGYQEATKHKAAQVVL